MKTHWIVALALVVVVVAGFRAPQNPPAKTAEERRIEVLTKDVVSTRELAEQLAAELASTRAQLEEITRYLRTQSDSAKELAGALDESEAAGFTFGINPESRHILLRAWRAQAAALQANVPGKPAPHGNGNANGANGTGVPPARNG